MILTFEFDNADEAGEMEYAFRDAWGHKFNTKWDGGVEVYVEVDDPRDENTPVLFFDKDYTEKRDGSLMESRRVRGRLVEEEEKLRYTDSELAKVALIELRGFKQLVVGKKYSVKLAVELERICSCNVEINGGDWKYSSRWDGTEEWDGTDEGIEWIRVEKYENLDYIYIRRTKGEDTIKENDISFDVVNEYRAGGKWEYEENAAPEFDGVDEEELKKLANRVEIESNVVVGGYVLADVPWHAWKSELDDESGNVRVFQGKKEIRKKGYEYVNTMLNDLSRKFGGWELRAFSPEYSGSDNWDLDFLSYVTDDGTLFGHSNGAYKKAEEYAKKNGQEFWLYRVTLPAWTRESDEEFGYDLVEDGKGLFSGVSVNEPY